MTGLFHNAQYKMILSFLSATMQEYYVYTGCVLTSPHNEFPTNYCSLLQMSYIAAIKVAQNLLQSHSQMNSVQMQISVTHWFGL